ncbi:MAG: hypothetical protein K2Q11_02560 [Burkholderiaceae bacterium]|nr:hypothetical protein [Burkholderiaceae bacterium]
MKIKLSQAYKHSSSSHVRTALVKPGASKAMPDRRGMADIKRRAVYVTDMSMSVEVADIREECGFAPVGMQFEVLSWPEL